MDTQTTTTERQTNDKASLAIEFERKLARLSPASQRQVHAAVIACLLLDTFEQWKRAEAVRTVTNQNSS